LRVFSVVVELQRSVERIGQEWLPVSIWSRRIRGRIRKILPRGSAVVGVRDSDAEELVRACQRVFVMIAIGYKESARGKLQYIGIVEIAQCAWLGRSSAFEVLRSAFVRGLGKGDSAVAIENVV
jgi:hypothetical protein